MKVAIIGNMNNNGFSIMRYFCDLGIDAHLLPFKNDGTGSLSYFNPEDDTWEIERWRSKIHPLDISNDPTAIVGWPKRAKMPPSKSHISELLSGYEAYIGSGISPALMTGIGQDLDIFYPYSTGIEYVGAHAFQKQIRASFLRGLMMKYIKIKQIEGVRNAKYCITSELSFTKQVFERIGKRFIPWHIPMVYNNEKILQERVPKKLSSLREKLNKYSFKIISHARLMWVRDSSYLRSEWEHINKHNDWLIHGYADFVLCQPNSKSILVLFEYGPDVFASKKLCHELGIEKKVMWLPKMSRKEIIYLLSACDIGVGEFKKEKGFMWGGTGWECMATGKPLLQSFCFTAEEYMQSFGHMAPPMLNVSDREDIASHLVDMYLDKNKKDNIGRATKSWFDTNNGIGLARKWADLLVDPAH